MFLSNLGKVYHKRVQWNLSYTEPGHNRSLYLAEEVYSMHDLES